MSSIGRNAECPCGSGLKHKRCCLGKRNWDEIQRAGNSAIVRNLTVRGKNLHFIDRLFSILDVDPSGGRLGVADLKGRITEDVVTCVYETVAELWPDGFDLERVLNLERGRCCGLFTGNYQADSLVDRVIRHSLYSDAIILVDPFMHPERVSREYNPLLHPRKYRTIVLKYAWVWISLAPLVARGLVKFVHTPGDFDSEWNRECLHRAEARFAGSPELNALKEQHVKQELERFGDFKEWVALHWSDDDARKYYRETHPNEDPETFITYLKRRRENHPYFLEPDVSKGAHSELLMETSGTDYEMAKSIANMADAHLLTDMPTRWKEMEIDREFSKVDTRDWAPFGKAFGSLEVSFLNQVPLRAALHLREAGHLDRLRSFLKRVWTQCASEKPFDEKNAEALALELEHHVREAEAEWKKIDEDLVKFVGGLGTLATPLIVKGGLDFVAAGVAAVAAGAATLGVSKIRRDAFDARMPAGFFLKLRNGSFGGSRSRRS